MQASECPKRVVMLSWPRAGPVTRGTCGKLDGVAAELLAAGKVWYLGAADAEMYASGQVILNPE